MKKVLILLTKIMVMSCTSQGITTFIYFDSNSNETFKDKFDGSELEQKLFIELDQEEKISFKIEKEYFFIRNLEILKRQLPKKNLKILIFQL